MRTIKLPNSKAIFGFRVPFETYVLELKNHKNYEVIVELRVFETTSFYADCTIIYNPSSATKVLPLFLKTFNENYKDDDDLANLQLPEGTKVIWHFSLPTSRLNKKQLFLTIEKNSLEAIKEYEKIHS